MQTVVQLSRVKLILLHCSCYEMDKKFSLRTCIPLSSMQVSLYDTYVCKSPLPLVDTYLKLHVQTKKATLLQKLHIVIKL